MTTPTFLLIGAARSGTTALAKYLEQHPEIFITDPKEPHFWAFAGETLSFQGPGDEVDMNRRAITRHEEYQKLYEDAGDSKAMGDGSVTTLYYPDEAIPNIKKYAPDAKLIAIIRNPIERAFSSFLYTQTKVHEKVKDFGKALDLEDERIEANWHHMWHYTKVGFYTEQLEKFIEAFGRERITIILFEDFRINKKQIGQELTEFLGVDTSYEFPEITEINRSGVPKSKLIAKTYHALHSMQKLKKVLVTIVPQKIRHWVRMKNLSHPKISEEHRARLREVYRGEIGKLGKLLDRDLSHWLK